MTAELATIINEHTREDGAYEAPLAGLKLFRYSAPTEPYQYVQDPALVVVAQGRKILDLAGDSFTYDPGQYLICSLDLPVKVSVTEA